MRLYFSPRVTIIGFVLIAGMLRLSYWQWERHLQKQEYIHTLEKRLALEPSELTAIFPQSPAGWNDLIHRRVKVHGQFDFAHEVILRNRRYDNQPGVFLLTPLAIDGTDKRILVSRGYVPLSASEREERKRFQESPHADFVGLIKESVGPKFLAPKDPPAGGANPWVDAWLRVDLENMQKQLPYPILPVFLETMTDDDLKTAEEKMIKTKSGQADIFFLPSRETQIRGPQVDPNVRYPVPIFDTVLPPGRHLGYVFEWGTMAVMTLLICLVIQMRPPAHLRNQK